MKNHASAKQKNPTCSICKKKRHMIWIPQNKLWACTKCNDLTSNAFKFKVAHITK